MASEAQRLEHINLANGEAAALIAVAEARAKSLAFIAKSLSQGNGSNAASLLVAEKYVQAFEKLAKENNTLIIPSNVSDIASLVGSAISIFDNISSKNEVEANSNGNIQQSTEKKD